MSQLFCRNKTPAINAEKFKKVFTLKKKNNSPEEDIKISKQEYWQRMQSLIFKLARNKLKMLYEF